MPLPPLVEPVAALSATELERTARHAALTGFGDLGQRRLAAAHVAVVGAGGLGSPIVLALTAAGIGTLTVIDDDVVETSNLQRQVLHRLEDTGSAKVDSAVRAAAGLSPETVVHAVRMRVDADNAVDLLRGADLVLDGTDSFPTRQVVAAACEQLGLPLVWGTVQGFDAQVTVFWSAPPEGHEPLVLRDLYDPATVGEPPSCAEVGVLGALVMQVGALMASEAIKLITGIGEPLFGRIAVIDSLRGRTRDVPLRPAQAASAPPVVDPAPGADVPRVSLESIVDRLDTVSLLDVREPDEVATGMIPGARNVPLADVLADPTRVTGPVIVSCGGGSRAPRAAAALRAAGIEATVLDGGIRAWNAHVRQCDAAAPDCAVPTAAVPEVSA